MSDLTLLVIGRWARNKFQLNVLANVVVYYTR